MGKLVKLALEGQLDSGYQVELVEIKEDGRDGRTLIEGVVGSLPPASEVYQDYLDWQINYDHLNPVCLRSLQKRGQGKQPTEVSVDKCQQAAEQFRKSFNKWLNDDGFDKLENILRTKLDESDEIRLIVKTTDSYLWKFPWSVWDFFEAYPKAEVAFSSSEAKGGEKPIYANPRKKVRILAICGDREGIDYENDQENLKRLRAVGAEPEIYEEPSLQKVRDFLWEKTWDIFFFAGHSDSNADMQTGRLYVNPKESLTPDDLKSSLKTAIEKGLKIAFLNSCLGLGLARQLVTELQIPLVIAMREEVPNAVAQKFLEYFLLEYAYRELPLYLAVRKARQRIGEEWQGKLPRIDWLPVICQNPAIQPPRWKDLHRPVSIRQVGLASVVCTSLVMAARFFGLLQPLELAAFDQLMKMRPAEPPDKRILVVTIDEPDIEYQDNKNMKRKGSLSDDALAKLLNKLERFKPTTIGLDIYHNYNFEKSVLANRLNKEQRFFVMCKVDSVEDDDKYGVAPPRETPKDRWGFSDVLTDDNTDTVRRHLLTMTPPKPGNKCQTKYSFNFLIALHYLHAKKNIQAKVDKGEWQIDRVRFKQLTAKTSGYQQVSAKGYQVLLNYRAAPWPQNIARQVSLRDVLEDSIPADVVKDIKNPIVLIGTTDRSFRDIVRTPYGKKIPGVLLQAQMVSQILSAVLDKRPLIWWWPVWGEAIWVLGWSLAGGTLILWIRHPLGLGVAGVAAVGGLFGICFFIFTRAGWVPLIPPALALIGTKLMVVWWHSLNSTSDNSTRYRNLKSWLG